MFKQKCPECRTISGRFHLCLKDASTEVVLRGPDGRIARLGGAAIQNLSPEEREERLAKMSAGQRDRWARVRQQDTELAVEVVELYQTKTMGTVDISKRVGISLHRVRRILKDNGVPMNPVGATLRTPTDKYAGVRPSIIEMYKDERVSVSDVAREHSLSFNVTRRLLQEAHDAGQITLRTRTK